MNNKGEGWFESTEDLVRSRYAETAAMRASRPRPSILAWIVSLACAQIAPRSAAAPALSCRP